MHCNDGGEDIGEDGGMDGCEGKFRFMMDKQTWQP